MLLTSLRKLEIAETEGMDTFVCDAIEDGATGGVTVRIEEEIMVLKQIRC